MDGNKAELEKTGEEKKMPTRHSKLNGIPFVKI
jgi:hypothetical protein